jgi:protease II
MKIGYIETFPLLGKDRWQKIPLENEVDVNIPLDATDEEIEVIMKKVRRIQYALQKQVRSFFYESNAAVEKELPVIKNEVHYDKNNAEWNEIKSNLIKIKFKEDAQEYINTTSYFMLIEAKQIINSKPVKNEKK